MKSRRTLSGKPGASNHEIAQVLKQNIDLADSKNVPESTFGVAKRLLHISELPSCYHLKYIEHGYRPHNQSVVDAFFSAFYFHNQTVNTWTHLIGFLMCFAIFVDLLVQAKFEGDDAFFAYFSISASICFLFSSLYHWFQCVSEDCRHTLLRLDLTGAIIHVVADFIGVFYYGEELLFILFFMIRFNFILFKRNVEILIYLYELFHRFLLPPLLSANILFPSSCYVYCRTIFRLVWCDALGSQNWASDVCFSVLGWLDTYVPLVFYYRSWYRSGSRAGKNKIKFSIINGVFVIFSPGAISGIFRHVLLKRLWIYILHFSCAWTLVPQQVVLNVSMEASAWAIMLMILTSNHHVTVSHLKQFYCHSIDPLPRHLASIRTRCCILYARWARQIQRYHGGARRMPWSVFLIIIYYW